MAKSYFNVQAIEAIFADCVAIGKRKNHDYGAARDTIAANGVRGIAIRMDDKQARILSLTEPGHEAAVKDESLRDTLKDQINYSAYAIMILDGTCGVPPEARKAVKRWMADFKPIARRKAPKKVTRKASAKKRKK